MASVDLLIAAPSVPAQPHVTIATIDGLYSYTAPLLSAIGIDELSSKWTAQDRPGRFPLTTWGGNNAAQGSLTIRVGKDYSRSVENDFSQLRGFAASSVPVLIACGRFYRWTASSTWAVTSLKVDEMHLLPGTNEIAQAVVTLQVQAAMTSAQARQIDR